MTGDVSAVIALRAPLPTGLPRLIKLSFGVHVLIAAVILGGQAWNVHLANESKPMTINLSGAVGPPTSGLTPLGGRQVDQATPEPKRPTPIPAVASKPEDSSVVSPRTTPKPATPKGPPAPTASVVSAPSTGRQVTTGSSVVETGSRGEGSGLAQGAGSTGAQVDPEFEKCCREYIGTIQTEVSRAVQWKQEAHGSVIVLFDILKDGSIPQASVKIEQTGGDKTLDIEAQAAVMKTKLPPLPPAYKHDKLTVHLKIPF